MAFIRQVLVAGFRGFAEPQRFAPAVPDGTTACSGLTILVGPNNGGKSALLEAIDLVATGKNVNMPRTHRHDATEYAALFSIDWSDENVLTLQSDPVDPHSLRVECRDPKAAVRPVLHIGIDREFPRQVQQGNVSRPDYVAGQPRAFMREGQSNLLPNRVPGWRSDRYGELLHRILDFPMRQYTEGQAAFVKVGGHEHEPIGLGYGVAALMRIIDGVYDAGNSTVLIDEPEISLHPSWQRRLARLLAELSAKTQIIYATHSPYMADWYYVTSGARLARIERHSEGYSRIHMLGDGAVADVRPFLGNLRNPHILGTNAAEIFFLQDGVILVEGLDDVVYYRRMATDLDVELKGEFYGWGVGGADNLAKIARVLQDLGYARVLGIVDGNRAELVDDLQRQFPEYHFMAIPAKDVRDKKPYATKGCTGLCDGAGNVHDEHRASVARMFRTINEKLTV